MRDGVLTAQLAGTLLLPFNEVSVLPIGSPVIAGRLVPLREDLTPRDRATPPTEREKRLWALDKGMVGGRLESSDLLSAIGTIEIPRPAGSGSDFLCTQSQFVFAKEQICSSPDVATSKSLDFDPRAECDALSVGGRVHRVPGATGPAPPVVLRFEPLCAERGRSAGRRERRRDAVHVLQKAMTLQRLGRSSAALMREKEV